MKQHPIRGFTLIEALVALAVFSIGMAALMPLAVTNVRGTSNAAVRTQAVALAQQELEFWRAQLFADLDAAGSTRGPDVIDTIYTRQVDFLDVPTPLTGDAGDIRRIRVVVAWNLPDTSGQVTLVTSKTRY